MAKVTVTNPAPPAVVLELSGEEAQTIYDILYKVGGDPGKTRRKFASAILRALDDGGFTRGPMDYSGGIYFS